MVGLHAGRRRRTPPRLVPDGLDPPLGGAGARVGVGPIGTLTIAAIAYVVARVTARRRARAIPATVVLVVVALGAWTWRDVLDGDPLGGPLGYQNANAALFVQAFVASLVLVRP